MKAELTEQLAEERDRDTKASAAETLCILLNNALCYMYENGMTDHEAAKYLNTNVEVLNAVDNEDYEEIVKKAGE